MEQEKKHLFCEKLYLLYSVRANVHTEFLHTSTCIYVISDHSFKFVFLWFNSNYDFISDVSSNATFGDNRYKKCFFNRPIF